MWDAVILGEGPAGISAALYLQRAGLKTVVIGMGIGALEKAEKIDNFYGFAEGISGEELHTVGTKQAKAVGAELVTDEVVGVDFDGVHFELQGKSGNCYKGTTVLMATGTARMSPRVENLKNLEGHGVSYCAMCDGFFYKGKAVAVMGEGDYALHEATELSHITESVTLLTNGKPPVFKVEDVAGIKIDERKLKKILGETTVEGVEFEDGEILPVSGMFVAVGTASAIDFARKIGIETNGNYIVVDEEMKTNVPGVYAAGDCTGGMLQVAKAIAEGAKAGTEMTKYIRLQKK